MPTQKKFRANDHDESIPFLITSATDANVFVADRPYQLMKVRTAYAAAAGGALTLDIKKCSGTTAPASGTTMLSGTINLNSSINTVISTTPSATVADTKVATGDRIAFDFTGSIGSLAGCVVTLVLRPTDVV